MKITYLIFTVALSLLITACGTGSGSKAEQEKAAKPRTVTTEEVKDKSFDELFAGIGVTEIPESLFKLIGEDFTVITSGNTEMHNSMVASWGGWGIMFNKPVTWCMLRANRYTLEVMREHTTYTMAYFDNNFKEQVMLFGTKSGRDSDKMKESTLTPVQTPTGTMAYKEAKLIIECKLSEITTVSPDDFYEQEGREFVTTAYDEAKEYHKLVFGNITGVWIRK